MTIKNMVSEIKFAMDNGFTDVKVEEHADDTVSFHGSFGYFCVTKEESEIIHALIAQYTHTAAAPVKVTEKERKVMLAIHEIMDMYGDGFSDAMTEDVAESAGLTIDTTKGVLGSLAKKGFVGFMDVNGEYNVFYLVQTGCDALGIRPDYYDDLLEVAVNQ